jgi:hypothetical protein
MTETNGPGHAAILRAAGHHDAADLVDAINEVNATPAADEAEPRPTPEPPSVYAAAEAQRQTKGRIMLDTLRRDCPDLFENR